MIQQARMRLPIAETGLLVGAALVVAIIVLANVPPGYLPAAVQRASGPLTRSYFQQNWRLFAPDPLPGNDQLLLEAKIRSDAGGPRILGPYDLQEAAVSLVRREPIFPSKLAGYALFHQNALQGLDGFRSDDERRAVQALMQMTDRYLSAMAERVYPGYQILQVRATLVFVPAKSAHRPGGPLRMVQGRTGWLPFISGVGR